MSPPLQHRDASELHRCQPSSGNAVSQSQLKWKKTEKKGHRPAATHIDQMLEHGGLWNCLSLKT